jgi:glycosyltransferase involved in cell wall biosynthesis
VYARDLDAFQNIMNGLLRRCISRNKAAGQADLRHVAPITVDGKFFAVDGERFAFRGVTYGTFLTGSDGSRFPPRDRMKRDFAAMQEAHFSVVRTYEAPTAELLDVAADWDLRVLAGVFYPDWRYMLGGSKRDFRRVTAEARAEVRATARRFAGHEQVLGLALGNEIPADVLRWYGVEPIAGVLRDLVKVVRDEDAEQLVTYANYPTAEYLPLEELDFLTFNVFLEDAEDLRRYLTRLQHLAGDRPLVLGELGLDAGTTAEGEQRQADVLAEQLEVARERGVAGSCLFSWTDDWWVADQRVHGWHFGLTREDRSPRPALQVAAKANTRTVRDLDVDWPSISVVICAYNAGTTLDECLRHTCALDYPSLEIIVADDGSTDDTAAIARRYPRARLLELPHGGLSVARNEGFRAATGDLIAYLDADAYPTPEWPYFMALGMDGPNVGGVGGPNVGPPSDPRAAHIVAAAPGGPVQVLISDDDAEHVPGCNMAFWREVLIEVGGFDPVFDAAGDDVDLCWRVLDRGWTIGFHPAALVWHHRRPGLRPYLRQQRTYGRSEALVEARHPDRFSALGSARWKGRIYQSVAVRTSTHRIYRGMYGAAPFQSAHEGGGYFLDILHQVGVPALAALLATFPLGLITPWLALPAVVSLLTLVTLLVYDARRAAANRVGRVRPRCFGMRVAVHQVLQPIVRAWARSRSRHRAFRQLADGGHVPTPVARASRGVAVFVEDRPRADLAATLSHHVRRLGVRSLALSGWEDHDGRFLLSPLVVGELVTSSHPVGYVQARIRPRVRPLRTLAGLAAAAGAFLVSPVLAAVGLALVAAGLIHGITRSRTLLPAPRAAT